MDKQTQQNLLDLVKKSYEQIAEDFDITRQKHLWPEIIKLASQVKDGDKVLDVGCGNGRLTKAFAGKRVKYVGVDNSEKMIETARENSRTVIADTSKATSYLSSSGERQRDPGIQKSGAQINLDSRFRGNDKREVVARNDNNNYKFLVGDILELDKIEEKDFDYVFCIAVLHHLPGRDLRIKALEQMKNKIKPGGPPASAGADERAGKIILTVWNLWSQVKFKKLIIKTLCEKIIRKLGLMSRRYSRDPDFALRTSGDYGDILFSWKNNRGAEIGRRYYHAFRMGELKKIVKLAGLKIERINKDNYNYYITLSK